MSIFNTMGNVFTKKMYPTEKEIEKIPPYILVNWISNSEYVIKVAQFLDFAHDLPISVQYKFAHSAIPKFAYPPKYPKPLKDLDEDTLDYNILMHKYKININMAKEYKKLLTKDELDTLRHDYREFDFEE